MAVLLARVNAVRASSADGDGMPPVTAVVRQAPNACGPNVAPAQFCMMVGLETPFAQDADSEPGAEGRPMDLDLAELLRRDPDV